MKITKNKNLYFKTKIRCDDNDHYISSYIYGVLKFAIVNTHYLN